LGVPRPDQQQQQGKEQRLMNEKKTITHWSSPDEIIDSGYGKITYREWCQKERDRINQHGDGAKIVTRRDGFIALSR